MRNSIKVFGEAMEDGPRAGKTYVSIEIPKRVVHCIICGRPYKPLSAEEVMQRWKHVPGKSLATTYCPNCWELVKNSKEDMAYE